MLSETNFAEKSYFKAVDVLILIVVEHALGGHSFRFTEVTPNSLNPYCGGTCSRRVETQGDIAKYKVLILIVVEHALGAYENNIEVNNYVLILIVVEHALGELAFMG